MSDMPYSSLVTTAWLADNLDNPAVKPVDGSWYLAHENRDGAQEFKDAHIPGAVYFDFNAIADTNSPLPHMFPDAAKFAEDVGLLGISNDDHVIAYGGSQTSACRVWWMFKAFGHDKVSLLDGGFTKWHGEGRAITAEETVVKPAIFQAAYQPAMVRDIEHILGLIENTGATEQILDARSAGRFAGSAPEPREGMRGGHMPGSFNLPYDQLLTPDHCFKDRDSLAAAVAASGIDMSRPIVTSCGSGVSAAVLLFALGLLGKSDLSLYDGSWSEWGGRPDTPIVTGSDG